MNYEDLVANKQAPKLEKQVWACDCGVLDRGFPIFGYFHTVNPVDGLCPTCRHYAVYIKVSSLVGGGS